MSHVPMVPQNTASALMILNQWLATKTTRTNATYIDAYKRVQKVLAGQSILVVQPLAIVDALYAAGYSPATVRLTVNAMSSLWAEFQRSGVVPTNPWTHCPTRPVKNRRAQRLLTESEVHRIIEAGASLRDKTFLRFLYATGCRIHEATTVTWQDLHQDSSGRWLLTVFGKGGKTRVVVLPPLLVGYLQLLAPQPKPGDRIWRFSDRRGEYIVEEATHQAGLAKKVSPHWFRHAHATHAIRHGAPLHVVQHSLGHANISTTGVYLDVEPGESSGNFLPPV